MFLEIQMRYLWLATKGIWIEYMPEFSAVRQRNSRGNASSLPLEDEGQCHPQTYPQLLMQLLIFELSEHGNTVK